MKRFNENAITQAVLSRLATTKNSRQKKIFSALVKHSHAFIKEIEPTEEEWSAAIEFLIASAAISNEKRNELVLLSDVLGISMLVDVINNRKLQGGTESSVLGPFYQKGAPKVDSPADLCGKVSHGEKVRVSGRVVDESGKGIAGAVLDIWQTSPNGLYHMQDTDQPEHNLCAKLRADRKGNYDFITFKPVSYKVPTDGPVGWFLNASGRHAFRPAHIHFIVSADGYVPVTTQLFTAGDEYIDTDAVFGVKDSLVIDYKKDKTKKDSWVVIYNFVLETEKK